MAPRKGTKTTRAPRAPRAPKSSTAVGPKSTTDANHTFRVDMGEALPPQAPFPTATDKHK